MSSDLHAETIARSILECAAAKRPLFDEDDALKNLLLMYFNEAGVKKIEVKAEDGLRYCLQAYPCPCPRVPPSQRRKWRENNNRAALLGLEQPYKIVIKKVAS